MLVAEAWAIRMVQAEPGAQVIGVDADDDVLRIAGRKASRAGARIRFSGAPPISACELRQSRLMLHHLSSATKRPALTEAHRLLRACGSLLIADSARLEVG